MRNKKRIIAAVLVASTFALGLTGCGSSKTETADNNATQTEDDANTETTDEADENTDADTGRIAIYYGCADTVTGLAFTTVDDMLKYIKENAF